MHVFVASRRLAPKTLVKRYGAEALCLDVTSRGEAPWVRFSPFFPLGGVPVPFSPGVVSASVEGLWQGLKVFESADVDVSKFENTSMKGLKRTVRRFGSVLGHRRGVSGEQLLSYGAARKAIYLPSYRFALESRLSEEVAQLRSLASSRSLVLLDYETNCDVEDLTKPLSHAGLIQAYLEGRWPSGSPSAPVPRLS